MSAEKTITLRCPRDGGFITEIGRDDGFGRGVCSQCGSEVTYRSKQERQRDSGRIERPEGNMPPLERTVKR